MYDGLPSSEDGFQLLQVTAMPSYQLIALCLF